MSRPFAVFDIDGTLIRWQLYHAVADTVVRLGFVAEKDYSAIRKARLDWKRRASSFQDYERQLVETYTSMLGHLTFEQFDLAAQTVFEEYKDQTYIFTRDLIRKLKKENYFIFAISGSQAEIVEKIASYYGFDDFLGTEYGRRGQKFSGKFIFHARNKDESLKKLVARNNASLDGSIAVGDSSSDIAMLSLVERPIAFNPERELFDYAKKKGWMIVLERKNMIYELESKNGQYKLAKTNR